MLRQLHITNLAVIADATLELGPGLNVFTGQTGAGKSLIIGAFEMLLGLRKARADSIRPGSDQARITGVFTPPEATWRQLARLFDLDEADDAAGELLLTRKLFATGRSSCAVNGQPVTAAMLSKAAELLVDIHGQHDHQLLLKPARQRELIDGFGRLHELREDFAERYRTLRDLVEQRAQLTDSQTLRAQQLDLCEFQAQEIDDVAPTAGEFVELQARATVLGSVQRLKQDAATCYAALYDTEGSVVERLERITATLLEVAHLDPAADELTEQVRTSTLTLQEAAYELSRYEQRLEHDPEETAEVDARLNALNRLISKYAKHVAPGTGRLSDSSESADPLDPVLAYREHLGQQIEQLRGQAQDADEIDRRLVEAQAAVDRRCAELHKQRQAAAKKLLPQVQRHLQELGMAEATLEAEVSVDPDSPAGGQVELLARTNPGQAMRPLREIASGGELSRIMLALKSVRQSRGGISVLVFDEVDANIGGRLGHVIGEKLRLLAQPAGQAEDAQSHQVLCITHLPQIAAFGHQHFRIAKSTRGTGRHKTTNTVVEPLTGMARIDELAEMMAGQEVTATTKKQAKELLAAAG
jgi:DNA repair protein RecN (Recombination protein N)